MIDIKTDANKTYEVLQPLLEKYKPILTSCDNNKITYRQVTIVLSGNKPYEAVRTQVSRFVFIDDDLKNMASDSFTKQQNVALTASCKYSNLLRWKGKGSIPKTQRDELCAYVKSAHDSGKKVRLWGSPEKEAVWKQLLECGVDLINTDSLSGLSAFLISNELDNSKAPATSFAVSR